MQARMLGHLELAIAPTAHTPDARKWCGNRNFHLSWSRSFLHCACREARKEWREFDIVAPTMFCHVFETGFLLTRCTGFPETELPESRIVYFRGHVFQSVLSRN